MYMLRFILILWILINLPVWGDNYNVYRGDATPNINENEKDYLMYLSTLEIA